MKVGNLGARSAIPLVLGSALLALAGCRQGLGRTAPEDDQAGRGLLAEITRAPTAPDTVAARAELLWVWANRYSLDHQDLPVNLPRDIATVRRALAHGELASADLCTALDRYARELELKQRDGTALGSLRFESDGPLVAGSFTTLRQTWTVGSLGMPPGGAILVAKQLATNQGLPQHHDPAADHYVTIASSRAGATFEPFDHPLEGMHGAFLSRNAKTPAFRLAGALEPGDAVTVTYGERSGGGRGLLLQTWATDRFLLPLYFDLRGDGNFLTPVWPALTIAGGPFAAVRVLAPSTVAAGEPFDATVRLEDAWLNRATGALPAVELFLGDRRAGALPAGGGALAVVRGITIAEPGVHRLRARVAGGAIAVDSNPVVVEAAPAERVWWGETHVHGGFAEGQGSAEQVFRYAREDARLDFLGYSEHDIWMDDGEWRTLQELAARFTEPGRFAAFLGYEWTADRDSGGHHNVFFRRPVGARVPVQEAAVLPELYAGLRRTRAPADTLVIPHAHTPGDWTQNDPELERLVEIYSMHGTFEWFGNLYLKNGFEVGFVGASDDHRAQPGLVAPVPLGPLRQFGGLAAVFAAEHSPDAIFDALRALRSYATSGERIVVIAAAGGRPIGSRLDPAADRRHFVAQVAGTAPLDTIDLIKNGEVLWSRRYATAPLRERSFLQVSFASSSEVWPEQRDNPRGYRVFDGTLRVRGATVASLRTAGLDNRYLDRAELVGGAVRFHVETRGRADTLLLELTGASAASAVEVELAASREVGALPGSVRPAADVPAATITIPLGQLSGGRAEAELPVDRHRDRIALQVVDPDAPRDQTFEFEDLGGGAPGDYYYLRIEQIDGARAWTSPWWIGAPRRRTASAK